MSFAIDSLKYAMRYILYRYTFTKRKTTHVKMKKELIAKKDIRINASPAKVWSVITNNESISIFMMGMKPVTDWKVGGEMNWIGRHQDQEQNMAKGKLESFVVNEKIQYSFFFPGYGHADIPEHYQTIIMELEKVSNNVTMLHTEQGDFSVFEEGETYLQHAQDFWNQAVIKIKALSE